MKFGRRILEESHGFFQDKYISYKELKKAIKLITGNDTSNQTISQVTETYGGIVGLESFAQRPPEAQFQDLLNFELDKVNLFAEETFQDLYEGLVAILRRSSSKDIHVNPSTYLEWTCETNDLADRVVKLHSYVRLNFLGFRKITKKYDKHQETSASCWYIARILRERFMSLDFDLLVELLALCFLRVKEFGPPQPVVMEEDVESLDKKEMNHVTYFVEEDSVMDIRIQLLKEFPLLSIGSLKIAQSTLPDLISSSTGHGALGSSKTTHPPLDSEQPMSSSPLVCCIKDSPSRQLSHYSYDEDISIFASGSHQGQHCQRCKSRLSACRIYMDDPNTLCIYRDVLRSHLEEDVMCLRLHWLVSSSSFFSSSSSSSSLDNTNTLLSHPGSKRFHTHPASNDLLPPTDILIEFFPGCPVAASPSEAWDSFSFLDPNLQLVVPSSLAEQLFFKHNHNVEDLITLLRETEKNVENAKNFLQRVIDYVEKNHVTPVVQQWIHRSQFHQPSHPVTKQAVYMTLDENIRFMKLPHHKTLLWGDEAASSSCSTVPLKQTMGGDRGGSVTSYGVLTVSYSGYKRPNLLSRISGLSTVTEIYRYSPLLHSMAVSYANQLDRSCFPEWINLVRPIGYEDPSYEQTSSRGLIKSKLFKNESIDNKDSRILVDVISTKPRDRVVHEHALQVQKTGLSERKKTHFQPYETSVSNHITSSQNAPLSPHHRLKEPLLSQSTGGCNRSSHDSINPLAYTWKRLCDPLHSLFAFVSSSWLMEQQLQDKNNQVTKATVRIEPKTFFANERTLLQWLNASVLLSTISIALLNFGSPGGMRAGLILAPVALFFIFYSFYVYLVRSYSLERREPINYNDRFGPSLLVFSLCGALSAIIVLHINSPTSQLQTIVSSVDGARKAGIMVHFF